MNKTRFNRAQCSGASFGSAECIDAIFELAECRRTDFSDAICFGANFAYTDLSLAIFNNTDVTEVQFEVSGLRGRCHGIRASECYGNARFRRFLMDQDYIDQLASEYAPPKKASIVDRLDRVFGGFLKGSTWIGGLVGGLIVNLLVYGDRVAASKGPRPLAATFLDPIFLLGAATILCATLVLVGFFQGKTGRRILFWLWSLFDYGRDWDRVVMFAAIMILVFGGLYAYLGDSHLNYEREGAPKSVWFYPWFVSLMGFATLGVTDLIEPKTSIGALAMMGNVLAGFVTLGLLLAVLGEKFARRAG